LVGRDTGPRAASGSDGQAYGAMCKDWEWWGGTRDHGLGVREWRIGIIRGHG